jgi:hypothetical protein
MSAESIVRLRISLTDTDPEIWRLVEVPAEITLKDLHMVIQAAMGWENAHLFEFHVGRERIVAPGMGDVGFSGNSPPSAARVALADLAADGVKRFAYVYDMGDSWEHVIKIQKILPADPVASYPRLIDGAGRCPPEDVGGVPGFYAFLEAIGDPDHPDHEDQRDWYGDTFDPAHMDRPRIDKQLAAIAAHRKRALAKRAG